MSPERPPWSLRGRSWFLNGVNDVFRTIDFNLLIEGTNLHHQNRIRSVVFKILVVTYGDQIKASDWSRGKGRFLTPVGVYKDVLLWIWMYIYIRNPDPSLLGSKKAVLKKIPDPPPKPPICNIVVFVMCSNNAAFFLDLGGE